MGTVTWFMSGRNVSNSVEIRLMHGCTAAIIVISRILSTFAESTGWRGTLNPLLQTDLMVIHPPVIFAYYSLCLAVASIALAGLIKGHDARRVHEAQLHWARAGFLIGTIGIGLGGLWAYTVLDWGGYWAWDPVETGSILSWFALLMIVHARARTDSERDSAILASPALGMLAGALAIHATLVTRANGVWASVHSFVGNEEAREYNDPYIRIVQLFDDGAAGLEVAGYFLIMISLCFAAFLWLVKQQEKLLDAPLLSPCPPRRGRCGPPRKRWTGIVWTWSRTWRGPSRRPRRPSRSTASWAEIRTAKLPALLRGGWSCRGGHRNRWRVRTRRVCAIVSGAREGAVGVGREVRQRER